MNTSISIIIPTFKRSQSLLRLVESLKNEVDSSVEIIVVEQGINNINDIKDYAKKNKLALRDFFQKKPSMTKARNLGIRYAMGEYVLFLDDDVVAQKKLIHNHLKNYKDQRIGAVGGRVLTLNQPLEKEKGDVGRISFLGNFSNGFSSKIPQEIVTLIGCNMSFRKSVLKGIGGFDEGFDGNSLREESDISLRLKRAGYKIVFEPEAVVEHLREPTGGARKTEGRMRWYFDFFSNETYFFLKHRPKIIIPLILLTRWEWALRCMFGFGREVSFRSMTTPILGVIDGIKKYRRLKKEYAYWS